MFGLHKSTTDSLKYIVKEIFDVYGFTKSPGELQALEHFKPLNINGLYLSVCVSKSIKYQHFFLYMYYSEYGYLTCPKKSGFVYLPSDKYELFKKIYCECSKTLKNESLINDLISELSIKIMEATRKPLNA